MLARSLKRRSTNIIGLYFGYGHLEPHDPFHAEVLTGLQRGCEDHSKDLMIHYSFNRSGLDELFAELVGGKIDGLVLIAAPGDPLVERIREHGLPAVAMTDAINGLPSVIADDAGGSVSIARHLVDRGHRTALYRMCPGPSDSASRRYSAFCEESARLGLNVVSATTESWKGEVSNQESQLIQDRAKHGITAAVCWGDPSANELLRYCKVHRIAVPQDLAIVGFNGIEPSVEPARRLTTVKAYWSGVAQRAVSLLTDRLEGRVPPILTVLSTEFVIGDTT